LVATPCYGVWSAQRAAAPTVDIAAREFSLALRHFSGRCRCKLWLQNENLIFESDFSPRGSRCELDLAKAPLAGKRGRRVTFIISAMAVLTERGR
jgi:hypothetical protein